MPHIISDQQYREFQAMKEYLNDPAPMPLTPPQDDDEDDYRTTCGLLEEDDFITEDEAWSK